jgi:hypothetical protein
VLQRRPRAPRVVEPEHPRAGMGMGQIADLRVVAVHDELGVRQLRHCSAPVGGEDLELAVAVELVAEEVPEQQRLRPDTPRHLGQCALVDFEEAELGPAGPEEGGGDAGHKVRARVVVRDAHPRPEDLRDHRGRRRLAVGRRDEHRSLPQPACEEVDGARIELPEELPRQRRPAAAAGHAGQLAGDAERRRFEAERDWSAHSQRRLASRPSFEGNRG